jgi:threonine/homoserine/homoserine lactone efflux protein
MGKPLKAQTWFLVGLVTTLLGCLDLMKHGIPHWPALICFAGTALLFWTGNQVRRQNQRARKAREEAQEGETTGGR